MKHAYLEKDVMGCQGANLYLKPYVHIPSMYEECKRATPSTYSVLKAEKKTTKKQRKALFEWFFGTLNTRLSMNSQFAY